MPFSWLGHLLLPGLPFPDGWACLYSAGLCEAFLSELMWFACALLIQKRSFSANLIKILICNPFSHANKPAEEHTDKIFQHNYVSEFTLSGLCSWLWHYPSHADTRTGFALWIRPDSPDVMCNCKIPFQTRCFAPAIISHIAWAVLKAGAGEAPRSLSSLSHLHGLFPISHRCTLCAHVILGDGKDFPNPHLSLFLAFV